jgi:hypothetical protein
MIYVYIMVAFILWVFTGVCGVIYWWTHDYDFTTNEIPLALIGIMVGPTAWLGGWFIHGNHNKYVQVLFHCRKRVG